MLLHKGEATTLGKDFDAPFLKMRAGFVMWRIENHQSLIVSTCILSTESLFEK